MKFLKLLTDDKEEKIQNLTDKKDDTDYKDVVIKRIEKPEEKEPKEKFTAAPKYKVLEDDHEYTDPSESTGEKEPFKKKEFKPKYPKKKKINPILKKKKNIKK